jgi:hypothetical protein
MSLANRYSATRPSQYGGAEIATSAAVIVARSRNVWRRIAEIVPTATPAPIQMTAAPSVSDAVAGSRSKIWSRTGTLLW